MKSRISQIQPTACFGMTYELTIVFTFLNSCKKNQKRNNSWRVKILWNSNFSASNQVWLVQPPRLFTCGLWLLGAAAAELRSWVGDYLPGKQPVFPAQPTAEQVCQSLPGKPACIAITHMDPSAGPIVRIRYAKCCFNYIHINHT